MKAHSAQQQQLRSGVLVLHMPAVGSTSTRLKELIVGGQLNGPTLLVTDHQTAGRGTRSRSWISAPPEQTKAGMRPRDLALSYAVPLPREADPRTTLAIGALLADAITRATRIPLCVKWPNDLLCGDPPRKVGGILVEQTHGWLLIGVGINVNSRAAEFPADLAPALTTLTTVSRKALDVPLLQHAIADALDALPELDIERWLTRFRELDRTAGSRYTLNINGRPVAVTAESVADSGELLLRDVLGGEHQITAFTELERA
ncbi:MAG: biotin--[acetyl-CoA-carboxylase] ligase [bacterium]|nr:biotin--[acetyl-CoA-carboxylase] ligase [bacterium]